MLDADLAALAYSGGDSLASTGVKLGVVARRRPSKVAFFLLITVALAATFAHFGHVTLLVALSTCHIFAFNFADV